MPENFSRAVLLVAGHATGGIGAHVASLAVGLPAFGWSPTVLTSPVTAERFDLGPTVVTAWPQGGGVRGSARDVAHELGRVRELVRAADVVHAHGHQAGTLLAAVHATLPRRRRPALVISWHNAVLGTGARARAFALAERLQARRADLVTGASDDLVDRARRLGARQPELAAVAAARPATPATSLGEPWSEPGRRVVLTVSRIAPQKNLDVLVEAARLLGAAVPDVLWLVAGDGDETLRGRLEQLIAATGAPVRLLGARADVPVLLAGAEVFVLPSAWEARALAVQEAMAAGLPVVASSVGGLPGLLDGAGILVPAGDAAGLAEGVSRVLGDPGLAARLRDSSRRRYAQLPTESEVVAGWDATYRRLVDR